MRNRKVFLSLLVFLSSNCFAEPENAEAILDMGNQLERLSKVNFHPNLLPIILKNSDYMDLTPEQVGVFKAWGENNFKLMVATMNEIIRKGLNSTHLRCRLQYPRRPSGTSRNQSSSCIENCLITNSHVEVTLFRRSLKRIGKAS